jgi:hypothetical protein
MFRIGDAKLLDFLVQAGVRFVLALKNAADGFQRARKRRLTSLAHSLGQVSQLGAQPLSFRESAPLHLRRRPMLERHKLAVAATFATGDVTGVFEIFHSVVVVPLVAAEHSVCIEDRARFDVAPPRERVGLKH